MPQLDGYLPCAQRANPAMVVAVRVHGDTGTITNAIRSVTGGYALLALFLASLELFGVLAHAVSRQSQEMGIRMAPGAKRRDLRLMVMREGATLTLAGLIFRLVGAMLLTRVMSRMLFGVSATDPFVYVGIFGLAADGSTGGVLICRQAARRRSIRWFRCGYE
jgi:ABC-type antimicrobial peptide transport system permease subunit